MTAVRTRPPNRSQAVMAQRHVGRDGLDDFPTHPWATRGYLELALGRDSLRGLTVWEPAANRGYMARVLREYCDDVRGSDIHDYGAGFPVFDFLSLGDALLPAHGYPCADRAPDWIVTNPPFKDLNAWIALARSVARVGVAILARAGALETLERYQIAYGGEELLHWTWSQYVERVPFTAGAVNPDEKQAGMMGWLTWWRKPQDPMRLLRMRHIPPCRHLYERRDDYR